MATRVCSVMHALLPLNFLHCPGATWAIGRMRMVGGLGGGGLGFGGWGGGSGCP